MNKKTETKVDTKELATALMWGLVALIAFVSWHEFLNL